MTVTAVPPFRGEFGITVRYHVPAVYALERPVVVCHEPGLEALYPDVEERIIVDRKRDTARRATYRGDTAYVAQWTARLRRRWPDCEVVTPDRRGDWPERRFLPKPHEAQGVGPVDVVVCPRKREHEPEKNWRHWPELAKRLRAVGLQVFAAGQRETSDTLTFCDDAAWAHDRELDATIEAMRAARLVVATDSGLAHLAVLCGTPVLMVTADGRPAPGYPWRVRYEEYYAAANWRDVPVEMLDAWDDVGAVVDAAVARLEATEAA